MKFLVDECLAPSLAALAREVGHPLSAHVVHRGMGGWSDARIMARVVEEDWTLVTRNADDFRPRPGGASARPCYVGVPLHAGLVCLNPPAGARIGSVRGDGVISGGAGGVGCGGHRDHRARWSLPLHPSPEGRPR